MIKIEFESGIAVYLIFTSIFTLVIWLLRGKAQPFKGVIQQTRYIWQCGICSYIYVDSIHKVISNCPRCNSFNKKEEAVDDY